MVRLSTLRPGERITTPTRKTRVLNKWLAGLAFGGLELDHQIEPLWSLYRQVTRFGTVQDFLDVIHHARTRIKPQGPADGIARTCSSRPPGRVDAAEPHDDLIAAQVFEAFEPDY